jgi:NAD(P)-dependent dehydrogenase (short-subunit alcohol dehydrogenase family)
MKAKALEGKVAVITGAGGGIGKATAMLFAEEGAKVTIIDVNEEGLRTTQKEIEASGGSALSFRADIRDAKLIVEIVEKTIVTFHGLDILANVAGIWGHHTGKWTEFIDSDEETWDQILQVNLKGTFICTHAVLRHMAKQGRGKIINLGSVAGVSGLPKMVDYSASKGAIISFTKALAIEVGKYNIQVNCVSPGSIHTHGNDPPTLLGRAGTPEEAAQLILFLASGNADFITGQNYIIDGGRTLSTRW